MGFSPPPSSYSYPAPIQYSAAQSGGYSAAQSSSFDKALAESVVENLDQFLKSRFFGTSVEARDREGNLQTRGTIVEFSVRDKGYSATIVDLSGQKQRLNLVFETSLQSQTDEARGLENDGLKQRFDAESYLNKAIAPIMADSGSLADTSTTPPPELPTSAQGKNIGHQIQYLDLSENKVYEGFARVLGNRVRLSNGVPLGIRFEKE